MLGFRRPSSLTCLDGGGEMGAKMRDFDWSVTPIGIREQWPEALRIAVKILLNTNHPMLIWWGPQLIQFYNDGFRQIAGSNLNTLALGSSGRTCWREIWDVIRLDDRRLHHPCGRVRCGVLRERQAVQFSFRAAERGRDGYRLGGDLKIVMRSIIPLTCP
jgi:hypothetical protein